MISAISLILIFYIFPFWIPRRPSYGVYISQFIVFARVCSQVDDFNARNIQSRFGFEGWIWVLISSVPGLCILLKYTFDIVCITVSSMLSGLKTKSLELNILGTT